MHVSQGQFGGSGSDTATDEMQCIWSVTVYSHT